MRLFVHLVCQAQVAGCTST